MTRWPYRVAYVVLSLVVVATVVLMFTAQGRRIDSAQQQSADNAQTARQAKRAAERLAEQVRDTGQTPVVNPGAIEDPDTSTPLTSSPRPSAAQVRAAVLAYCSTGGCAGPAGRTPTSADVAAAVRAYCAVVTCRGARGATGETGAAGEQGAVGAPGQDGTAGEKGQQGAAGEKGQDGAQGAQGAAGEAGAPGAQGEAGPAGPQGPQGEAGAVTPGSYSCGAEQYLAGFDVDPAGVVALDCRALPGAGGTAAGRQSR